jgi:hypothetical protein
MARRTAAPMPIVHHTRRRGFIAERGRDSRAARTRQSNALSPVMACPSTNVWMSWVPS